MKAKYSIILLYLSILSVVIYAKDDANEKDSITIDKAIGSLTEYEKEQIIILSIIPPIDIIPINFTKLEFKKGSKSYELPTKCNKAQKYALSTSVTCTLDLTNIFVGIYQIASFEYKNKTYQSNALIKVNENKNKIISDIKLIDFISPNNREYSSTTAQFELYFDGVVYPSKFNNMIIESEEEQLRFKINLGNCAEIDTKSVKCYAKFLMKAGKYKIINIFYSQEFIMPEKDIFITLVEDIVDIEKVYNKFGGGLICNDQYNPVNVRFKNYVQGVYFSKFYFKNIKTNIIYELNNSKFKAFFSPWNGGYEIDLLFDFHELPIGKYYINFIYKRRMTYTNAIIEVKECKHIDDSQIYED